LDLPGINRPARIATNTTCLTRTSFPALDTKEFATRSPRSKNKESARRGCRRDQSVCESPGLWSDTRHGGRPEVGTQ
jgi:hypothetical protein